jgi:hypothetical protein
MKNLFLFQHLRIVLFTTTISSVYHKYKKLKKRGWGTETSHSFVMCDVTLNFSWNVNNYNLQLKNWYHNCNSCDYVILNANKIYFSTVLQ